MVHHVNTSGHLLVATGLGDAALVISSHHHFVQQNYFCDHGDSQAARSSDWCYILYTDHRVTDSGDDANCCALHSGPWFNTILTAPTTDDIEI